MPDATAVVPGNAGDDVKYASNPTNFDADRTVGNNDQRHRLVLSGVYDTNGLGERRRPHAGARAELVVQRDLHGAVRTAVHRARGCGRSERRRQHAERHRARDRRAISSACDTLVTFDPRIARDIPIGPTKLQLIWEAFNLFNRDNINGVDTTYYSVAGTTLTRSTTFGRPLASSGERIMQLAVKLTF